MEFDHLPEQLLRAPLRDFAGMPDAVIDALHARALAGDRDAIHRLYLALAAERLQRGTQCLLWQKLKPGAQRLAGAAARAQQQRTEREVFHAWAWPLFADAEAALLAEGRARVGRDALATRAKRLAAVRGIAANDRLKLSPKAARAFLDARKAPA